MERLDEKSFIKKLKPGMIISLDNDRLMYKIIFIDKKKEYVGCINYDYSSDNEYAEPSCFFHNFTFKTIYDYYYNVNDERYKKIKFYKEMKI